MDGARFSRSASFSSHSTKSFIGLGRAHQFCKGARQHVPLGLAQFGQVEAEFEAGCADVQPLQPLQSAERRAPSSRGARVPATSCALRPAEGPSAWQQCCSTNRRTRRWHLPLPMQGSGPPQKGRLADPTQSTQEQPRSDVVPGEPLRMQELLSHVCSDRRSVEGHFYPFSSSMDNCPAAIKRSKPSVDHLWRAATDSPSAVNSSLVPQAQFLGLPCRFRHGEAARAITAAVAAVRPRY